MGIDFSSPSYVRSRRAYILQAAFEYFVALLVADAFLAKLLGSMGFAQSEIGIISSFISLAFVFQLFSLFLSNVNIKKKTLVLLLHTAGQFLFLGLYMLPFLPLSPGIRRVLVYVFIICAYMGQYLVSSFLFKMANNNVHPEKRASFSAVKEIVSLVSGMVFSLVIAKIFELFESADNMEGGFVFFAIAILVINIFDFVCIMLIKSEESDADLLRPKRSMTDIFRHTFGNKNFILILIVAILWKSANYFTAGFMGAFRVDTTGNGLGLGLLLVQIIAMAGSLGRALISRPFGKYSDRHSFAAGFYLALFLAAGAFTCNIFTTEKTWFLTIGYTLLHGLCMAGINANTFNMVYSYVESEYIAEAMAIINCISGVCGFGASLIAARVLEAVQGAGNTVLGVHVFGQQILGGISLLICVACIIFMRTTILKQKVMKQ